MSRIILEGVDGTGKTTLGMRLADECRLGYYRKRCMHGIPEETERALLMTDCVLDRSWMTDVVYSQVYGRVSGCSRASIYKFGLLAARHCCLYVNLGEQAWTVDDNSEKRRISHVYEKGHWSVPTNVFHSLPARPHQELVTNLLRNYQANEQIVDGCPSRGIGTAGPCDVLINYFEPVPIVCDLLFACGLRPWQVHFADYRESSDQLNEWFKPKLIISNFKTDLTNLSFEAGKWKLSEQLKAAGVFTENLEPGWRVLEEGPQ